MVRRKAQIPPACGRKYELAQIPLPVWEEYELEHRFFEIRDFLNLIALRVLNAKF